MQGRTPRAPRARAPQGVRPSVFFCFCPLSERLFAADSTLRTSTIWSRLFENPEGSAAVRARRRIENVVAQSAR
jgi:hypothetical protein